VGDFSYSDAMASHGGDWTPENLFHFLANPKEYVPGTKMSFAGLPKPEDRADVIAYLEQHPG
jgi:cytochrome c